MQTILEQAKALAPEVISWRDQIHMQPEVGLDLPKTVALSLIHISILSKVSSTGVEKTCCGVVLPPWRAILTAASAASMEPSFLTAEVSITWHPNRSESFLAVSYTHLEIGTIIPRPCIFPPRRV